MKSIITNCLILVLVPLSVSFTQALDSLREAALFEKLLNSNPQDAHVFYKDSLIGYTPLFISSRFDNLVLRKHSYEVLNISFEEITSGKVFSLNFVGNENETAFFNKDIFKFLTAGIIVLGGATAYFKLKADNKFEEYQSTGDNRFLEDTRRLDLISGITFAALQVNFGMLLYYFLIE